MKPRLLGTHGRQALPILALMLTMGASCVVHGRDPLRQPFHQDSIWNRPIGSEAVYVPAKIQKATARGMTVDEDLIVLTPDAPLLEIHRNDAGWNRNRSRCTIDGPLLFRAPIPPDFIVSPDTWDGLTPNSGLAVLMPDGRTIKQTQPFARCTPGHGTSRHRFDDEDLFGLGYYGAHGGSGLSCIGGTLRVGELVPDAGPIRHTLKVNLYAARNLYYDEETRGYRWPARRADGYAARTYGTKGTPVKACRMGTLLALPPALTDESLGLETEPARRLAQAFRDYGAYVVDDTAWDVYALVTEWGPAGRVTDEFKRGWGFEINPRSRDNPWSRDMDRIFTNLHVVDNNGSDRIGGGGQPRVLLAEPLSSPACPTATERRVPPQCLNPTLIQTSKRNPWSAGAGPRFDDRAAKMYQLPVKTTIDLPNEPPHRAWGQPSNPRPGP